MPKASSVSVEKFEQELYQALKEYGDAVYIASDKALDAGVKILKNNLKDATPRDRPEMYKQWKSKKYKGERYVGNDAMVQGKKGEIPLSNILEFSTKRGHPFIRETYERSINEAVQAYINTLKKGI